MSEWKEFQLGELYNVSSGLSKAADQFGFGNTFISFKDVFNSYFLPENPEGLVNSNEKEQISCSVKAGDILLTRTSETNDEVGMSSVALKDYEKSTFNGFCKRLRIKKDAPIKVSSLYIGYLLRTRFFRKTVANFATMTTRASLNSESIKGIPLLFPSFSLQKEIGKTLHCLDKKINLLKQQNQTMEELAQTLFKRWFVEFEFPNKNGEPYKSSGGKMVESELGEIPDGWRVVAYENIVNINSGKGLKKDQFVENGQFEVIGANGPLGFTDKYLTEERLIITGRVGTLGTVYIITKPVWLSDNVLVSKPITESHFYFSYFTLKRFNFSALNSGSTQPLITQGDLKRVAVTLPISELLEKFHKSVKDLFEKSFINNMEIQTLTQLRDTLLPKLMRGELKVIMNKKQEASERTRVF
ncbi:restriction endonuclease subunit S [Sunxiuqinia indica]|uniref:restriction endonuclease subunit S n=1 Tax=Sunxiuqinia indica TaxID=2692584 RepID=UPI00135ACC4A|nr:restriction endonuclease subunit S [Sunxiuqinia indica]